VGPEAEVIAAEAAPRIMHMGKRNKPATAEQKAENKQWQDTKPGRIRLRRPTYRNAPDEDQDETKDPSGVHDPTEKPCLRSQTAGVLATTAGLRDGITHERPSNGATGRKSCTGVPYSQDRGMWRQESTALACLDRSDFLQLVF